MKWIALSVTVLMLALLPLSGSADTARPFQPVYDLLPLGSSAPSANSDVVQQINVPQGDHAFAHLKYTLPAGWDIANTQSGNNEPIVGSGLLQVDVGTPATSGCDGVPETYPLTIFDMGKIQGDPPGVETNWFVRGYPFQQFIFAVKGSSTTGQTIESSTFTVPPEACTPISLALTFQGVSSDNPDTTQNEAGRTVLTNPATPGVYTWSVEFWSKPLAFPPEHVTVRCDQVGVGTTAPDTDADGIADGCDSCPSDDNPGQRDIDDDGLGDACDPGDFDLDGFSDRVEYRVGTDPGASCSSSPTHDANPADVNNDTFSDIGDIVTLAGSFVQAVPPAPARHDIAPDPPDGVVDIGDLVAIANFFGQSCAGP